MQNTFAGRTAKQIVKSTVNGFVTINGTDYTVVEHDRVELNNGNHTSTVVIESMDRRVVLYA